MKHHLNRRNNKIFHLAKLVVIGGILIVIAMLARVEVNHYWNNRLISEAKNFKPSYSQIHKTVASSSSVSPSVSNACSSNTLSQLVLVSISQRELWACSNTTVAYSSPVITGMSFLAADLTPTGTYHIYAKETNTHLIGHDSTGSWDDYVNYWMPFLDNQYGQYGFHDATWRPATAFGNVSPSSTNASHGCVECPLATASWLYSWTSVGTTVTIES